MVIRGRVKNGVVVVDDPSVLPDGAEVCVLYPAALDNKRRNLPEGAAVTVHPEAGASESKVGVPRELMTEDELKRYRQALAEIRALPKENPGDTFSGADHDQVLYGGRQ